MKDKPNKVTTVLKVVVAGEFYDDDATEETLRYAVEQDLEDAGFDVDVALLKEHEAVEPILIREGRNKNYNDYVCPRCDNEVVYEQNYCSECGISFLWEGR